MGFPYSQLRTTCESYDSNEVDGLKEDEVGLLLGFARATPLEGWTPPPTWGHETRSSASLSSSMAAVVACGDRNGRPGAIEPLLAPWAHRVEIEVAGAPATRLDSASARRAGGSHNFGVEPFAQRRRARSSATGRTFTLRQDTAKRLDVASTTSGSSFARSATSGFRLRIRFHGGVAVSATSTASTVSTDATSVNARSVASGQKRDHGVAEEAGEAPRTTAGSRPIRQKRSHTQSAAARHAVQPASKRPRRVGRA